MRRIHNGSPVPGPERKRLDVSVSAPVHGRLHQLATAHGMPVGAVARLAVERGVDHVAAAFDGNLAVVGAPACPPTGGPRAPAS